MVNSIGHRSKVEQLGQAERAIELSSKGLGSIRIAKKLSDETGVKFNATNIDNFFKAIKTITESSEVTAARVDNALIETKLKVLSNWADMDTQLGELLVLSKSIQDKCIGVNKKTGEPVMIKHQDLRLWKDCLEAVAKISETRLKAIGQIKPGVQHIIYNIENQYNDLKQIVLEAEKDFPGIGAWVSDMMVKKSSV